MAMTAAEKKAKAQAYYVANREAILARVSARARAKAAEIQAYKKNYQRVKRAEIAAKKKAHYASNCRRISEWHKAKYAADSTSAKERSRRYRLENPAKARAAVRAWGKANPARLAAMKLEWQHADQRAHPERYREIQARRKAQKLKTQTEKIDYAKILRAAKGICGICRQPFDLFGIDFDHIVPLARGGTHTKENIQATHSRCNRAKGAKVI